MRNYEVTLIFSSEIAEEKIQETLAETAGFLQEKGGLLGKQAARKENNERIGILGFTLSPEALGTIEQFLKTKKEITRFMIGRAPEKSLEAPVIAKVATSVPEEQKASMEDIDKKLEEIFKAS